MRLLAAISLLSVSVAASADNLNVSNGTEKDLTFKINNICSQEFGVIKKWTIKVVSDADFRYICAYRPQACEAEVYDSTDCSGNHIANLVFDTKYGIQKIQVFDKVRVMASGFNVFFEDEKIN